MPMMMPIMIPPSMEAPEGMKTLYADRSAGYEPQYVHDVVYSDRNGKKLTLQMIYPEIPMSLMIEQMRAQQASAGGQNGMADMFANMPPVPPSRFPLIVFIPGSAWFPQNTHSGIFRFADFARAGYVVAVVEYTPSTEAPWPAFFQDVKAAIRFLRANADLYGIDKTRVGVWGDSSGGHASLLVGSTGWTREFDDERCAEESSDVKCCVDFYGLSDIARIHDAPRDPMQYRIDVQPEDVLFCCKVTDHPEVTVPANPIGYIHEDQKYPPFLIVHGDCDGTVPFNQSVLMYNRLRACGKQVEFYKILNAGHSFGIWTKEVVQLVMNFFRAYL